MNALMTKAALSAPRRWLLETMQRLNFGRIEDLEIRNGEPVLDPAPRVLVEFKLDTEETPRGERDLGTFVLRAEVVRLLAELDRLGTGAVERIDVRYGIPRRMIVGGLQEVVR